jgi:hypothetical protein
MQLSELAWGLAESVTTGLTDDQRCRMYIALGAGDFQTVISGLSRAAVATNAALPLDVAGALNAWNTVYGDGADALIRSVAIDPPADPTPAALRIAETHRRPEQSTSTNLSPK